MFNSKLAQIKAWAVEQVLWAETYLQGKSGAEKKAAVVKKLDDLVKLPAYLEWADDLFFSWLVDKVCEKLNAMTKHNFLTSSSVKRKNRLSLKQYRMPEVRNKWRETQRSSKSRNLHVVAVVATM